MPKEYTLIVLAAIVLCGCARHAPAPVVATAAAAAKQATPPGVNPLTGAARDAVIACIAIDALSLNDCGSQLGGTEAHTAARRALSNLYRQRDAFMDACQKDEALPSCLEQSDIRMVGGMALVTE